MITISTKQPIQLLYVSWRKTIRKISHICHCNLLHHINSCNPIDNIMEETLCYVYLKLMHSGIILYNRIVKHSLSMSSTYLGENIIYLCSKYGICGIMCHVKHIIQ